jgi:hypothetical protein
MVPVVPIITGITFVFTSSSSAAAAKVTIIVVEEKVVNATKPACYFK